MTIFEIFATLITLAAIFSYFNHRFLKLPTTIGLMVMALVSSLILIWIGQYSPPVFAAAQGLLNSIDFNQTLMHGMLGFLLFAGALHVNLSDLRDQRWVIALLATFGILLSTFLAGCMAWIILNPALDLGVPFLYCLLLGAIVSPTDPIAVMGILKSLGAPKSLETKITGESLFNDGVGVVVFLAIAGVIGFGGPGHAPEATSTTPDHDAPSAIASTLLPESHAEVHEDKASQAHPVEPSSSMAAGDVAKLFLVEAVGELLSA